MTPDRTWDHLRFQRGTRGFAAFVMALDGFAVLGLAAVVAPATELPHPGMAWLVTLGLAGGIAHLVAVVGLVRARSWARSLVAYVTAAGIGAAVFALLLAWRAGEPVLGADGSPAIGFSLWLIGTWLVALRFTFKAYTQPADARQVVAEPSAPRSTAPAPEPRPTPRGPLAVATARG